MRRLLFAVATVAILGFGCATLGLEQLHHRVLEGARAAGRSSI